MHVVKGVAYQELQTMRILSRLQWEVESNGDGDETVRKVDIYIHIYTLAEVRA
jgi:hypothetical protein